MSGWMERENELRLDILESLSRSQRALASIIENVAEVSGSGRENAEGLLKHIHTLVRVQQTLAERMLNVRIRRVVRGNPGALWLSAKVAPGRIRLK
jgi:hypothetical protein